IDGGELFVGFEEYARAVGGGACEVRVKHAVAIDGALRDVRGHAVLAHVDVPGPVGIASGEFLVGIEDHQRAVGGRAGEVRVERPVAVDGALRDVRRHAVLAHVNVYVAIGIAGGEWFVGEEKYPRAVGGDTGEVRGKRPVAVDGALRDL